MSSGTSSPLSSYPTTPPYSPPLLSTSNSPPRLAHRINKSLHIKTPLIYSPVLSSKARANVYLKLEQVQPSGSFKNRGIGFLCAHYRELHGPAVRFVISSGGNAGLACAYSARALGSRCTVFVPTSIPSSVINRLKIFGAEVVVHGSALDEAREGAERFTALTSNAVYIPPFDHPLIIEGHKSLIHEISSQLEEADARKPDAIICSVGGGGLLAGLLKGIAERAGWEDVSILACETSGAASLSHTLRRTYSTNPPRIILPQLETINTIAASLGSKSVSADCMQLILDHSSSAVDDGMEEARGRVVSVVMEDQRTVAAIREFANDHATLLEPACACSLVPIYLPQILRSSLPHLVFPSLSPSSSSSLDSSCYANPSDATMSVDSSEVGPMEVGPEEPIIVVIVCGGNAATLERLWEWEEKFVALPGGEVRLFEGFQGLDKVL